MIRSAAAGAFILALFVGQVFVLERATVQWKVQSRDEGTAGTIPAPVLKVTALDYDGVVSDYLFLKSLVFIGSTFERTERPRVKPWEWKWLYNLLDASAWLDPYFRDPYYFANAHLTWDGHMYRETNALLDRGTRFRSWDSLIPFFMGFNHFYFLQDYARASDALMIASERPGASPLYASLAAKIAFKAKRTETAVTFLDMMIKRTDDELIKKEYQDRLQVLQGVLTLERAVQTYERRYRRKPADVQTLLKKKILHELPPDPYGGKFSIDEHGEVRTTSEKIIMPYLMKK